MVGFILQKLFGTKNDRELQRIEERVRLINQFESSLRPLSDQELRDRTGRFREELSRERPLDELLPEAFAVVREAGRRVLGMRHFDVQLVGGVVLHEGKIAEMKTGEGKTLVATLPVYLNALTGRGVHVVTVNDYLAKRDSEWMGSIYRFLGLTVGVIQHHLDDQARKAAYTADVTYGTNNEYGFDYLRDNMKYWREDLVQRDLNYAIVDEVDSILVDEARTPLIISGPVQDSTGLYYRVDRIIPSLLEHQDFAIDEKLKSITMTEEGVAKAERLLGVENLYDIANMELLHHVNQGLRAHHLYKRDVDYVVKDGEVIIVDEFTGRLMQGRRWSEGLHQAVEAKEKVRIAEENQTLATITFQNYFRMYKKLAGMTGTADTEAVEFKKTYNLDVVIIPPNRPLIRNNYHDQIYRTEREKFDAVVDEIKALNQEGRPVLVGTISIEKSEKLHALLKRQGIEHHVLNAKYHEKEAEIVARAGQAGAVTIATNMAGRGTDIILGGGVAAAGGLHIIGTERHESRRIDNQLRGRAGRQGDPGSSRFYLSLEDDLLRIFGSDRISSIMQRIGMEEGEPIEHRMVTKAIENAQKRVEAHNFDIRKQLLEYDDVMNQQREHVYSNRRQILMGTDIHQEILTMVRECAAGVVAQHCSGDVHPEEWDRDALDAALMAAFHLPPLTGELREVRDVAQLKEEITQLILARYDEIQELVGPAELRDRERMIMLNVLDTNWKDHLYAMDGLKEGIGLRGYGQKNPLTEYKREGYYMFSSMIERVREEVVRYLFRPLPHAPRPHAAQEAQETLRRREAVRPRAVPVTLHRTAAAMDQASRAGEAVTYRRSDKKVGRNDPCPCGSGKKYKKCCGAAA
jgi:preprotein translocase subunit SecA